MRTSAKPSARVPDGSPDLGFRFPGATDTLDADRAGLSACRPMLKGCLQMGSVVKKRRKRMAKKKHRKLLRKTRVQRRRLGK